jgi:hypothetical protein
MPNASVPDIPNIGYLYHYPRLDHPSDNFCLDIYLFSAPTEQHFDVLRSHFSVASQQGTIERLTVKHPWAFGQTFQVCGGLVEMEDWKGKKEEAFTFGGSLTIDSKEMVTTCSLASSAPILEISGATPLHALFIEEVEILLAERKAANLNPHEYEAHLIKANPLKLYRACLEALIDKFENFPHKDEQYLKFLVDLWIQKRRIAATALAKGPAPSLIEIL